MCPEIPSVATVKAALSPLSLRQIQRLAALSGVPAATIYKVKRGETENPGIETVRRFYPLISQAASVGQGGLTSPSSVRVPPQTEADRVF
jgi:predicted transcriptional regulator